MVLNFAQLGFAVGIGERILGRRERGEDAAALAQSPQIAAGGKAARFGFTLGAHHEDADAALRCRQPGRWPEVPAVALHDLPPDLVGDEMRERERQAEIGGIEGALVARSEEPDFRVGVPCRRHPDARKRVVRRHGVFEKRQEIGNLVREMLDAERPRPVLERDRGQLVAARGAADA